MVASGVACVGGGGGWGGVGQGVVEVVGGLVRGLFSVALS